MLADFDFSHTSAGTSQSPNLARHVLATSSGVSAAIISNQSMTIAGISRLLIENPEKRLLIVDNNPFNSPKDREAMQAFLSHPDNRDRIRIVDHHGPYNDGKESSTFPRLLARLPDLEKEGFLGPDTVVITNMQNLDPDGILSMFAAANPEIALRLGNLLSDTANFTDFSIFGGETFDRSFSVMNLPHHKILGLALLQLITDLKENFVERVSGCSLDVMDRDAVRNVFVTPADGKKPHFDESAVREIYLEIMNARLIDLFRGFEVDNRPSIEVLALALEAEIRLKANYCNAAAVTKTFGHNKDHAAGRIAVMTPETGFSFRLDSNYVIYDWLLEGAAQYCTDAPIHLRVYKGMLVISVRHKRENEDRQFDYDLSPLISRLNQKLSEHGLDASLYGRKEVVLGQVDTQKLSTQIVMKTILEAWDDIARVRV